MGQVFCVVNQKGGVGKTTTAINLGSYIAEMNKNVLLVDMDPQGNATSGVGVNVDKVENTIYDLFSKKKEILDVLYPTSIANLHLLPAGQDLAGASVELVNEDNREMRLKEILDSIKDSYDYVLIDCPPSLGILTVNALAAADKVLVPVQCEYFALEGLSRLVHTLELVKDQINPTLDIEGIILTMYDPRTMLSKEVVNETKKFFKDKVYETVVPRNVRISEAPSYGQPISIYADRSKGAAAYRSLAKEVLGKCLQLKEA